MTSTSVQPLSFSLNPPLKVWQDWPGEQYFFQDGKLYIAKKWMGCLATFLFMIVPVCVHLSLVAPKLDSPINVVAIVVGCALAATFTTFLLQTFLTDPGILPKLQPDAQYLSLDKPRMTQVIIKGVPLTLRYDETYHFYRPPRAHHCSETHVVVERFDHFCPWMGQAIGLRNYRPFVSFLVAAMLLLLSTLGFCVTLVVQRSSHHASETSLDRMRRIVVAPILIFYCAGFALVVSGILGFHCYLIFVGQTTYENQKDIPKVFSRGPFANCYDMWCLPTPPPFVSFSQPVEEALRQDPPMIIQLYNPPWCDRGAAENSQV